ncbi:MAG: riboflavin synthase [Candidatus Bipolaricaulia bacterium]
MRYTPPPMFTGIVQGLGTLRGLGREQAEISVPDRLVERLRPGASVAVNGICLTVSSITDDSFLAGLSSETASRTTLGSMHKGARVNLELPIAPADGLDGHLVLGHVDAVGTIKGLFREKDGWVLIVGYPPKFRGYVAEKGSIAVDGISLTPYGLEGATFRCSVIPETYERTTLQDRRSGDPVNVEFDVLAKYVERMVRGVHHD